MNSKALILNASVIIAFFSELERPYYLEKLSSLGFEILVPQTILDEELLPKTRSKVLKFIEKKIIKILPKAPQDIFDTLRRKYIKLGKGELEVLSWGLLLKQSNKEYTCVLEDKHARKAAKDLGLNLTGTLGLLNILERENLISPKEKNEALEILIRKGFRIKLPPKK